MFEIELFICTKIDLLLNNLQMLICHKTQQTNKQIIEGQTEPGNNCNDVILHSPQIS